MAAVLGVLWQVLVLAKFLLSFALVIFIVSVDAFFALNLL